jgi:hypothetical protein
MVYPPGDDREDGDEDALGSLVMIGRRLSVLEEGEGTTMVEKPFSNRHERLEAVEARNLQLDAFANQKIDLE